jgi:hypothetical protein
LELSVAVSTKGEVERETGLEPPNIQLGRPGLLVLPKGRGRRPNLSRGAFKPTVAATRAPVWAECGRHHQVSMQRVCVSRAFARGVKSQDVV